MIPLRWILLVLYRTEVQDNVRCKNRPSRTPACRLSTVHNERGCLVQDGLILLLILSRLLMLTLALVLTPIIISLCNNIHARNDSTKDSNYRHALRFHEFRISPLKIARKPHQGEIVLGFNCNTFICVLPAHKYNWQKAFGPMNVMEHFLFTFILVYHSDWPIKDFGSPRS